MKIPRTLQNMRHTPGKHGENARMIKNKPNIYNTFHFIYKGSILKAYLLTNFNQTPLELPECPLNLKLSSPPRTSVSTTDKCTLPTPCTKTWASSTSWTISRSQKKIGTYGYNNFPTTAQTILRTSPQKTLPSKS